MSKKINSYVIIDFETGGLSCLKNPACEIALLGLNGVTLEEVLRYDNVIKPYDASLVYEQAAMNIHGLTAEVCERDGERLRQVMEDFCLVCTETNVYQSKICPPILVGHNVTFDIPFLEDLARRTQTDLSKYISGYTNAQGEFVPDYIDTMHQLKLADGHKDAKIKFSLVEGVRRHAGDLADGHRAMNDVVATCDLFRAFVSKLRSSNNSSVKVNDGSGLVRKNFKI